MSIENPSPEETTSNEHSEPAKEQASQHLPDLNLSEPTMLVSAPSKTEIDFVNSIYEKTKNEINK